MACVFLRSLLYFLTLCALAARRRRSTGPHAEQERLAHMLRTIREELPLGSHDSRPWQSFPFRLLSMSRGWASRAARVAIVRIKPATLATLVFSTVRQGTWVAEGAKHPCFPRDPRDLAVSFDAIVIASFLLGVPGLLRASAGVDHSAHPHMKLSAQFGSCPRGGARQVILTGLACLRSV